MRKVMYTLASLGAIALLFSALPDIRRYLRIRAM
jgi:hypothetical protein